MKSARDREQERSALNRLGMGGGVARAPERGREGNEVEVSQGQMERNAR